MDIQTQVAAYLDYCRFRKELDEKTIKAYRIDIRQFFEAFDGRFPEKWEIERYVTELHKNYKQKTVKRKLASIKALYNYLEDEELIEKNPFHRLKVKFKESKTLPRIIPRQEIELLLNRMYMQLREGGNRNCCLRDIAVVEMLFATGARVCEVSNIRMENVDLTEGLIRIMGKGGKERYLQIGSETVLALMRDYYEANREDIQTSGFFFVNGRGNRLSEQSIRIMVKKYAVQTGIERTITPHMFRHSVATYLIEAGVDISYVQRILGHSSIGTTQIYIHVAAGKQAEILRKMHPRNDMKIENMTK